MAAFEPWMAHMSNPKSSRGGDGGDSLRTATPAFDFPGTPSGAPPTYAAFSPATLSTTTPSKPSSKRLSTILVYQKSPLLLATPPQITRALAYSHPFLLPLNKIVGLLSWTSEDPWESFLLLAAFWAVVLYGDVVTRVAGPIVVVLGLILGMYSRRYSPLSSSGWTEPPTELRDGGATGPGQNGAPAKLQKQNPKGATAAAVPISGHQRVNSEATSTRHQKTLDEMVETLKEFTGRCNVLMEPMLELTDFLSTQRTPTSATTRPALTTLFVRILLCTPFWVALTLPPWRIITTRRVLLVVGTLVLSWHSRVMRVSRAILWRSKTVRRVAALVTGLAFEAPVQQLGVAAAGTLAEAEEAAKKSAGKRESELTKALKKPAVGTGHRHRTNSAMKDAGVKFTFIIYENQRRWVGLGWTSSLFAYERAAWTDEHNNAVPAKDAFELPEVEDGSRMRWRWVPGSRWKVDGVSDDGDTPVDYDGDAGKPGWIFYDNKWQNGRRGQDSWGRWTRRRKWYRDAELVEIEDQTEEEATPSPPPPPPPPQPPRPTMQTQPSISQASLASAKGYSTVNERMVSPSRAEFSMQSLSEATAVASSSSARSIDIRDGVGSAGSTGSGAHRDGDDSSSVMSTSSRSFFRPSSLRKRVSERSTTSAAASKGRRASEAKSEEEVAALGLQVELGLQGHGKEGQWGIGDEARMGLE